MAFTANPEDYTARGKIITPLKDRIGSEIRTHYASSRPLAMAITAQEAWLDRPNAAGPLDVPVWVREVIEEVAFQARADRRIDKRSGVSQRLPITVIENVASNAERRALLSGDRPPVARLSDVYAALPSITGKFELEYEGELRGAETVARELIRSAVANVFLASLDGLDTAPPSTGSTAAAPCRWRTCCRRRSCCHARHESPACSKARGSSRSAITSPRRCERPPWSSSSRTRGDQADQPIGRARLPGGRDFAAPKRAPRREEMDDMPPHWDENMHN
jgi:hypothetical protein